MITCLIDNIDSNDYGFKYLRKEMESRNFEVFGGTWLRGANSPSKRDAQKRYIKATLYFLYQGSENDYQHKVSNLTSKIIECNLKFSDCDFNYAALLTTSSFKINKIGLAYEIGIEFNIYSKTLPEITEQHNKTSSVEITNAGNADTPFILELTSEIDQIDVKLSGLSPDDILIKNLKANEKIIMDGYKGTILAGTKNKFPDVDIWDFPTLKGGLNTLTLSRNNLILTVKYKPEFI